MKKNQKTNLKIKKSTLIIPILIIILVTFILLKLPNKNEHLIKCRVDGNSIPESKTYNNIYFYFDDKDEKIIKEEIEYYWYYTDLEKENGNFQEDKEYYFKTTVCDSILVGNNSCTIEIEEERAIITGVFNGNNLSKNILVYNMDKKSLEKYLKKHNFDCE